MLIIDSLTGEEISVQYSNKSEGVQLSLVYTSVLRSVRPSDGSSGQPVASISKHLSTSTTAAIHGDPELPIPPSVKELLGQPSIPEDEVPLEHIPVIRINEDQSAAQGPAIPPLVVHDDFQFLVPGRVLRPRRVRPRQDQNIVVQ